MIYFIRYTIILFILLNIQPLLAGKKNKQQPPKLAVIIVIDQFAYHFIEKLRTHFHHGFKFFLDNGIVYENAYHPHGIPETSPGHCALSTGVLPKDHGISMNSWYSNGKKITFDNDLSQQAALLGDNKLISPGKSSHHIQVDGLSDQFYLQSKEKQKKIVFSLSLKPRAAIATANKLGKAIWFDDQTGNFTSSKKYFKSLPSWINNFNKKHKIPKLTTLCWKTVYPKTHEAYQFPFIKNYDYAGFKSLIFSPFIQIDHHTKLPYMYFLKTPHASKLLFELAKECINHNLSKRSQDMMLLWISASNLDLVGHIYGPDSFETIDLIYHLDKQIQDFISYAQRSIGSNNVLFILTADHGIEPLPEISYNKGITSAQRIMAPHLINAMNSLIKEKYNLENIVAHFESSCFWLNKQKLQKLDQKTNALIIQDLKNYLLQEKGIKHVWTPQELKNTSFQPDDLENFYKNSLYNNQLGDLICMPHPYCIVTNYPTGCSHTSPYDYDTHVPLIIYQKGHFKPKNIYKKIWIPQVPVTLAALLQVPQPSASSFTLLPGIFDDKE